LLKFKYSKIVHSSPRADPINIGSKGVIQFALAITSPFYYFVLVFSEPF